MILVTSPPLSLMWALKIAAVLCTGYRVSKVAKHPLLFKFKAECEHILVPPLQKINIGLG